MKNAANLDGCARLSVTFDIREAADHHANPVHYQTAVIVDHLDLAFDIHRVGSRFARLVFWRRGGDNSGNEGAVGLQQRFDLDRVAGNGIGGQFR